MKKFYNGIVVAVCLLFCVSCTTDFTSDYRMESVTDYDASFLAIPFLSLKDGKYDLQLSLKEANKLGISDMQYEKMKSDIDDVNDEIERLNEQHIKVYLADPSDYLFEPVISLTRSEGGGEVHNIVSLESIDQNKVTKDAFIPIGANSINIHFYAGGLIDIANYEVTVSGQTSSGSGTALLGYMVQHDLLAPAATNTTGTFGFRISNSNGGSCVFYY